MNNFLNIGLLMYAYRILVIIVVLLSGIGCRQTIVKNVSNEIIPVATNSPEIKFAKGFTIEHFNGHKRISVMDPWQGAEDIMIEYYLVSGDSIPDELPDQAQVIKVPVRRIICTSTTHIGMLDYLGKLNTLVGVSGSKYINNPWVVGQLEKHEIVDR